MSTTVPHPDRRRQVAQTIRSWGPIGFGLMALAVSIATAFIVIGVVYKGAPAVGIDTRPAEDVTIVPATGDEGFPVETFCQDDKTTVKAIPAPDASGVTYQMLRVRDGVTETVRVVTNAQDEVAVGTHYWDQDGVQQDEPAVVTQAARECIDTKANR